jgi:hypothetical protein
MNATFLLTLFSTGLALLLAVSGYQHELTQSDDSHRDLQTAIEFHKAVEQGIQRKRKKSSPLWLSTAGWQASLDDWEVMYGIRSWYPHTFTSSQMVPKGRHPRTKCCQMNIMNNAYGSHGINFNLSGITRTNNAMGRGIYIYIYIHIYLHN